MKFNVFNDVESAKYLTLNSPSKQVPYNPQNTKQL